MKFNKLRITFTFRSFFAAIAVIVVLIITVSLIRNNINFSYFSTRCIDYRQRDFSGKLNDRLPDYSSYARQNGIKPCSDSKEIMERVAAGRLVKIKSGRMYQIDRMKYSYSYLTGDGKDLLDEIGKRFTEKTRQKGIRGSRFYVTSMTRAESNIKSLRRSNSNASENSPHLYGNTFDISYSRFEARKWILTNCDRKFLKEALAEVIWELRNEKKCWATYERVQSCFHVVCR
jgi:hypothetical protein